MQDAPPAATPPPAAASNIEGLAAQPSGQPPASAVLEEPFELERYDPTRARERMRGAIAIAILLLSIMAAVVLFAFVALWTQRVSIDDLRTLLEILFAPLVGLVGAVTGFYYGSRAQQD